MFPRMSVLENPKMGGYTCGKEQIQEGIERAFSLFPILKERSGQPADTFSGGEQQMLSLGRALMTNPKQTAAVGRAISGTGAPDCPSGIGATIVGILLIKAVL